MNVAHAARPRSALALRASFVLVSPAILFFLWMLSLSLKNEIDNTAYPPVFIPDPLDLDELRRRSSSRTTSCSISGTASSSPAARRCSRCWSACRPATASPRTQARKARASLILIARMTPALSYLIPLFLLFQWLGLHRHAAGR